MKSVSICLASSLTMLVLGCGGGGGSDDERNVSGIWRGALTKISETCAAGTFPQTFTFSHSTTQNGEAINLTDEGGRQYLGNRVGDDGFSVDNTSSGGTNCQDARHIEYNDIDDDDDSTGSLELQIRRTCGTATCEVQYTGTATRSTAASTPTPSATATPNASGTPGATPTPSTVGTGGCYDINPNTVAGGFSGDGGCGISNANYSLNGSTVVLEPFGGNGATSFAISSTNSSSATSARGDLTIKGVSGYSCTLVCSPPSTFTVSCFREGGTTCAEKF